MKIEVGTYHTRDGRTAVVTKVDEKNAIGTIDGTHYIWWVRCGSWMMGSEHGVDLVTRIIEPTQPEESLGTTAKPPALEVRPTQWTVTPTGNPIFDECAMTLRIEDEAGGEFLVLENVGDGDGFRFDVDDWPTLRALIDEAVKGVRK